MLNLTLATYLSYCISIKMSTFAPLYAEERPFSQEMATSYY